MTVILAIYGAFSACDSGAMVFPLTGLAVVLDERIVSRMVRLAFRAFAACFVVAALLMTQRAALAQSTDRIATITGVVTDSVGHPVADASVQLSGPSSRAARTDSQGAYTILGVPFGSYRIVVRSKLGVATKENVQVDGDVVVAVAYDTVESGLKTIAVVSSSANARFNVTPASVQTIKPSEIALSGETSWRHVLEQMPGVTTGSGSYGGGSTNDVIADAPFVPVQLSINGALPYETATLIDGMPIVNFSFSSTPGSGTDLGNLPLTGFGSADIVRGPGADSPSILNSIGGSFVLHPADRVAHNSFDASVSNDPYGGIVSNAILAHRWNKLSVRLSYGINDSPGPVNGAYADAYSFPYTDVGNSIDGKPFTCTGDCGSYIAPNDKYSNVYTFTSGLIACCFQMSSAWSQHTGSASLSYDISPTVSASIFYGGLSSEMGQMSWRRGMIFTPPAGYTGQFKAGLNYFIDNSQESWITQSASIFEERINAHVWSGDLQLAALQNTSYSTQSIILVPQTISLQLWGGGAYGDETTSTPVTFTGDRYTITQPPHSIVFRQWSNNRDLSLRYRFPIGPTGQAGFSIVHSYYNEPATTYRPSGSSDDTPPDLNSSSDEVRFFVGGDILPRLTANLSEYIATVRYHVPNPDGSGSNVDRSFPYSAPRVGLVWRPLPSLAVRGSAGGGFAAAPLNYLIGTNGDPTPSDPPGSYSVSLVNLSLRPETSFGLDIGADWKFDPSTTVSLDAYRTRLFGQLYSSTMPNGTYNGDTLFVTQYGNIGESRYQGLIASVRHDVPKGPYWSATGGFTRAFVVSVPAGFYDSAPDCTMCTNLTVVPNVNFNGSFLSTVPYSQAAATLGYRWAPRKSFDVSMTYFGPNNSYYRPAFAELDAHAEYPVNKQLSLGLTLRNLTNVYGDAVQTYSPYDNTGVPVMAGLPYALTPENYGPRAVIVTTRISL